MNDDTIQLIAVAILALTELYAAKAGQLSVFAYFWDFIATLAGRLANFFADIAMQSRLNYYEALQ